MFGYSKNEQRQIDRCLYCFENIHYKESFIHYFSQKDVLCASCRKKMKLYMKECVVNGMKINAIYIYDDYLEKMLFQYKEAKDIALSDLFFMPHLQQIKRKYRKYTIVFMPSSLEKTKERGFNSLELLLAKLELKKMDILYKKQDYKQSKQHSDDRKYIHNVIAMKEHVPIKGKILLVDDVCTSGESLKAAYTLLKQKYQDITILTLAIHQAHVGGMKDEKLFKTNQ